MTAEDPVAHQLVLNAKRNTNAGGNYYRFDEVAPIASNLYAPNFTDKPQVGPYVTHDFLNPPQGLPENGFFQRYETTSSAIADTIAAFDDRLLVTVGVRHLGKAGNKGDPSRDEFSPGYAALFKITPKISVYGNKIEAYQPGATAPQDTTNAGEVLSPVAVEQKELGVNADFGNLGATLAWFDITQPNYRVDPTTRIFESSGLRRHRGVEASTFGQVLPSLRLLGSALFLDPRLVRNGDPELDGNRAPGGARRTFALGAEWDLPWLQGLVLSMNARRESEVVLDEANSGKLPAITRYDAGARYVVRFDKPVTLRATVDNLTDKAYWIADGYGSFYQSNPRTLRVSATADFYLYLR